MLPDEDAPYAVIFTSGSTGSPKGAVRSYRVFLEMMKSYSLAHSPRHLSFQPVSHLSERMYLPALLLHGGALGFSRGGAYLLEELAALEPTTVSAVPRLFEVMHATYRRKLRAAQEASPGAALEELRAAARAEVRGAFGRRVTAVSVGSAPVSAEVLAFLRRCFADLWVSEGYGSTEVGSIAFDGKIADHVEVKLVPPPQASGGEPGAVGERGEIYVRTPHRIAGYLGDEAATAAAFDGDGFFATGDLGVRDADGKVRIVGRSRNTVKLAQGEFVSIERVETTLATAAVVDRIFVHIAHGAAAFAALVVPQAAALAQLLGEEAPVEHPRAAAAVLAELRAHGRAAGLLPYELPRAVKLMAAPFTVEDGTITASGKLARGALAARHGEALAQLAALAAALPVGDGSTAARLARVAGGVLGRAMDPATPLGPELGIDSLAAAEILAALSAELGIEVPLAWWFEARDLQALAQRLDGEQPTDGSGNGGGSSSGSGGEVVEEDLARPLRVAIAPAAALASSVNRTLRRVLLTGATGFLGAPLICALAGRGIASVCLVRAPDDASAAERVSAALQKRRLPAPALPFSALAGDLGELHAGGAAALSARLDARDDAPIDAIVHAGATVSWLAPYAALRGPNVLGTLALLELAALRGLPMHYVSTISTAPSGGDEDSRLELAAARAGTPYGLSKWIAEEQVRRAGAAGLPVAIYRPAMIAGDTRTGIGNPEDFLSRYLAGCAELGLYLDRDDALLDMTPVDFVAEAIAALVATRPQGDGQTYALANTDQSLSYAALGRAMAGAGAAVAPASYPSFRAALLGARGSRLSPLAAFFPEQFALGMEPCPCRRTLEALAKTGVVRPRIDAALIARYVAAL